MKIDTVYNFPPEANINISDENLRKVMYEVFEGKCFYTQKELEFDNFHIDHVIPKTKKGPDNYYNYVISDPYVNKLKSNKIDEDKVIGILYYISIHYAEKIKKRLNNIDYIKHDTVPHPIQTITDEDKLKVLKYLHSTRNSIRNRVIAMFSFYAGLTANEIKHIRWNCVMDDELHINKYINLNKNRIVPIHSDLRKELYILFNQRKNIIDINSKIIHSIRGNDGMSGNSLVVFFTRLYKFLDINASSSSGKKTIESGLNLLSVNSIENHPYKGSIIKADPIKCVKKIKSIKKLLRFDLRNLCIFTLGVSTPLKPSELLSFNVGFFRNIQVNESVIYKGKEFSFSKECLGVVNKYLKVRPNCLPEEKLIVGKRGPLTVSSLSALVKKWCTDVNLHGNYSSMTLKKTYDYHLERDRFKNFL